MKATLVRVVKAPKIRKETPRQAAEREAAERLMADGARCRREERITGAPPLPLGPDAPQGQGMRSLVGRVCPGTEKRGSLACSA
jgi:hypothetical protein